MERRIICCINNNLDIMILGKYEMCTGTGTHCTAVNPQDKLAADKPLQLDTQIIIYVMSFHIPKNQF